MGKIWLENTTRCRAVTGLIDLNCRTLISRSSILIDNNVCNQLPFQTVTMGCDCTVTDSQVLTNVTFHLGRHDGITTEFDHCAHSTGDFKKSGRQLSRQIASPVHASPWCCIKLVRRESLGGGIRQVYVFSSQQGASDEELPRCPKLHLLSTFVENISVCGV